MASITTELVDTGAKRDGRGRRIATPAERVAMIAQYRDSGLTQRAFAGREGIKFSTFTSVCWLTRAIGSPAASNVSVRPGALQSDLIVSNAMSE